MSHSNFELTSCQTYLNCLSLVTTEKLLWAPVKASIIFLSWNHFQILIILELNHVQDIMLPIVPRNLEAVSDKTNHRWKLHSPFHLSLDNMFLICKKKHRLWNKYNKNPKLGLWIQNCQPFSLCESLLKHIRKYQPIFVSGSADWPTVSNFLCRLFCSVKFWFIKKLCRVRFYLHVWIIQWN